MILLYGPAGSGKSTQGQLLAKKLGREWLSAGELIRNSDRFEAFTSKGAMIDEETLVDLIREAVDKARAQGKRVVFDGQPGSPEQIEIWRRAGLLELVELVIVLDVPHAESIARLKMRGRADDRMEVWEGKIKYFEQKIYSFLTPVKAAKIPVYTIDGTGSIEAVNARIMQKINSKA